MSGALESIEVVHLFYQLSFAYIVVENVFGPCISFNVIVNRRA